MTKNERINEMKDEPHSMKSTAQVRSYLTSMSSFSLSKSSSLPSWFIKAPTSDRIKAAADPVRVSVPLTSAGSSGNVSSAANERHNGI